MIKGILFDMDGVLSDSEPFICKAAVMMFSELGQTVEPGDFIQFVGTGENMYLGGVAGKYGIKLEIEKAKARTYEIYLDIIRGNLKPLPGARGFVLLCREKGFKLAIATSSDLIKMKANLEETGIPLSSFDASVTGSDVINKKPAPDIYLKAAGLLGLKPEQCLVVEDAVSGIRSGKAAGCKTLAVTTSFEREALSEADWICNSLDNVPGQALNW